MNNKKIFSVLVVMLSVGMALGSEGIKIREILGKSDVDSFLVQLEATISLKPHSYETGFNKENKATFKQLLSEVMDFSAQEVKDLNQDIKQYQQAEKKLANDLDPELATFFSKGPDMAAILSKTDEIEQLRTRELGPKKEQFTEKWGTSLKTLSNKIKAARPEKWMNPMYKNKPE